MDLRPQAHVIIRTWIFSTIVRSYYEVVVLPWANAGISGFIVDPDRKKLSKSAENAPNDPMNLIERHGADAVRYWAAQGRPGMDMTFDESQMKIGRRLATKLLNASRFALNLGSSPGGRSTEVLDRVQLAVLADLVEEATAAFERFDYARAIERTEEAFWPFCDDYLELIKNRAYGSVGPEGQASAQATLGIALETFLKLFAPFLPYVTEEVWSWWRHSTIHRESWPDAEPIREIAGDVDPLVLAVAADVLREVRKAKTQKQVSMRAEVARLMVIDMPERLALLGTVEADLRNALVVAAPIDMKEGGFSVEVTFA
jgi:valyl-tRNA synthetase